ncbi:MAG: sulfotransferase [Wenzhouxiangellaceae bacterium]
MLGADLSTLLRTLPDLRQAPLAQWPLIAALFAAALGRLPFSLLERLYVRLRASRQRRRAPPVFILGHWRSGTTHLYNLLSRDPQFVYVDPFATGLPWNFLLLGRWLRPLLKRALPADRYIDRVAVNPDSPQEDEIGLAAMQNLSYYFAIYFPQRFAQHYRRGVFLEGVPKRMQHRWARRLRHYFLKLELSSPGRRLLIKNPVYTGRVDWLRRHFPDARFIHIYRNPYVVFQSTRKFYRSLLPRLALQPFQQNQADELILQTYPWMLEKLRRDTQDLPAGHLIELRFEDLEQQPLQQLEKIYQQLQLDHFEQVKPRFESYLQTISGYRKNRHGFPADAVDLVDQRWGSIIREWGYQAPS